MKPFQISSDPKYLWLGEKHREALAVLKYGIMDNRGFLLLTGDVGTGKTTIINALVDSLGENVVSATIPDPGLDLIDFLNFIGDAFKLNKVFRSKGEFLTDFREFLLNAHRDNKKVLLIIDEAQRLNPDLLEEIRLLSNIEKEDEKLLNIFFVGQNEFNAFLLESKNRALLQRITINFNIDPLTQIETGKYIWHRLKISGSSRNMFSPTAIRGIYGFSMGYPRLINIICDHALLTGYVDEKKTIEQDIIEQCADELRITPHINKAEEEGVHQKNIAKHESKTKATYKKLSWGIGSAILLLLFIVAGFYFYKIKNEHYTVKIKQTPKRIMNNKNIENQNNLKKYILSLVDNNKNRESITEKINTSSPNIDQTPFVSGTLSLKDNPPLEIGKKALANPEESKNTDIKVNNNPNEKHITDKKIIIYYQYNSNEIPEKAYEMLDRLAITMNHNPEIKIDVKGYSDQTGGYLFNVKLSEFRAYIIKTYLIAKGVDPLNIRTIGMGPKNPIIAIETENSLTTNRRVEIELYNTT